MNSPSGKTKSSKSSIASSIGATAKVAAATMRATNDDYCYKELNVEAATMPRPKSRSDSRSSGGSSSHSFGQSTSCSMPESEARWSDLPALKPLVNPRRLQDLRLSSRDSEPTNPSQQVNWHEEVGGGDISTLANPTNQQHFVNQQPGQDMDLYTSIDASSCNSLVAPSSALERNQCNSRRRHRSAERGKDAFSEAGDSDTGRTTSSSMMAYDEGAATLAASASMPAQPVYQYSFRVPETRANMRAFCHASDRRVEAIARACDSEILLDPEPIRTAAASVSFRRITVRAPDLHSLEKCCRMFDATFPQFYASSGLGPGGRGVSKVYDDDTERYISASNDEMTYGSCS